MTHKEDIQGEVLTRFILFCNQLILSILSSIMEENILNISSKTIYWNEMKWKKETNCFYIIYYKVECSCLYFSRPKHVNVMFVHNLSSTFCLPYTLTMVLPLHIHCHNTELIRNALTQVQKRTCDYSNDGMSVLWISP
jgi:hypothetical protein